MVLTHTTTTTTTTSTPTPTVLLHQRLVDMTLCALPPMQAHALAHSVRSPQPHQPHTIDRLFREREKGTTCTYTWMYSEALLDFHL